MKGIARKLAILAAIALVSGCAGTNPVQSTVPTGPLTLEPQLGIFPPTKKLLISPPQYFVLTNTAGNTGSAIITSVATNSDQFQLQGADSTCPSVGTLPAGLSCKIVIKFVPSEEGRQTATLTVTDSGSNSPQTVNLYGDGMK